MSAQATPCRRGKPGNSRPDSPVNNHRFGAESDFFKLILLRKIARRGVRLGFVAMLTEPLRCLRDEHWEREHRYLREQRLRHYDEGIFDFLLSNAMQAEAGDMRCLPDARIGAARLLPNARFFIDILGIGRRQRARYFAKLLADRHLLRQRLLYFDPTAGLNTAARPSNPSPDYLEFAEIKTVAQAAPHASLLVAQSFPSPVVTAAGTPTRTYSRHRQIANRLRALLRQADSLLLLHAGREAYYAVLRTRSPLHALLPQLCSQIDFGCRTA